VSTCILCDTSLDEAQIVGTTTRTEQPAIRRACTRCGLVQIAPAPSATEFAEYYASGGFWRDHQTTGLVLCMADGTERLVQKGDPEHDHVLARMHQLRAEAIVADLQLPQGSYVLEIGCGDGKTLAELQKLGMKPFGIDADVGEALKARERGVGAEGLTLDQAADNADFFGDKARFDAVFAAHVLEHFTDPLDALGKMRSLLKPGGKLWIEVPNVLAPSSPLSHHWLWVHTFDFSEYTLAALLKRAGFDDVQAGSHGNLSTRPARLLRATAVNGTSPTREYRDHTGPNGEAVASFLRQIEEHEASGSEEPIEIAVRCGGVLPRFLAGESVRDLGGDAEDRLRHELRRAQAGMARLAGAYHQATQLVGELSQRYGEECYELYESWHADPYVYGTQIGKAEAFHAAKDALAYTANAMRMVELTDGEREGE
jgi:SAM-dependent methyltransferase